MKALFVDIETGGLEVGAAIIQIAAVAVDGSFSELEAREWKLKFDDGRANAVALQVNHYSAEQWAKEAVEERRALVELTALMERHADCEQFAKRTGRPYNVCRIGGHNISRFDLPHLQAAFKRYEMFMPAAIGAPLDTLHGAVWYFDRRPDLPRPRSLQQLVLAQYFGLAVDGDKAHEALYDARLSIELAKRFRER